MTIVTRQEEFSAFGFLFIYVVFNLLSANGEITAAKSIDLISNIKKIDGFLELAPLQVYSGGDLIDYINGGAELYFAYNFKEACVKQFRNELGSTLTVEIYEMDKSENAYGVYSFDTYGESVGIGQDATYGNGLLRFWKGRFFIRIFASDDSDNMRDELLVLGGKISDKIQNESIRPLILSRVPKDNIVPGSLHYFHKNVCLNNFYYVSDENILKLGNETEAVTYEYQTTDQIMRVVLIQYPTPEQAKDAFFAFNEDYFRDTSIEKSERFNISDHIEEVEEAKHTCIRLCKSYVIVVFEAGNENSCKELLDLQTEKL
ncbi:hypothetical protein AMJ83_11115 [candidate division WOR_3 bacterium SM23_42]|uniref:Uncharacterized protein n=1 Tax=candidate division WOR_3 bacterium SM23_42 TaxID=1703779 RepID=A0A0S8FQZ8_UNCW3|nr:MAG: hypothetical protein AMJ83_11115 [candidate division WOR_3 bacterium SM23_42]